MIIQNQKNIQVNSEINNTIFETNRFLIENKTKLIQCAAFFGSFQIFKYLLLNNANLNSDLWIFAIHGRNYEIIYLLEEKCIECPLSEAVIELIKCNHNEMVEYLLNSFSTENSDNNNDKFLNTSLMSFNFAEIINFLEYKDPNYLLNLACKYDYCYIVDLLLNIQYIDVNKKMSVFVLLFEYDF